MIKFLKRWFFPKSYYKRHLEDIQSRFLKETKKDKLLATFAKWLLPLHEYFERNCIEDRWAVVDKYQFNEVYEMGTAYCMGMKIIWT